jgi:hypothetical protein
MRTIGWLIEISDAAGPRWLTPKPMYDHTDFVFDVDANAALRFCRREDAQAYFDMHRRDILAKVSGVVVTEHVWPDWP